jgi:hypothetical protein
VSQRARGDDVLLLGAYPRPSAERRWRLARAIGSGPDWTVVIQLAERHDVAALLHAQVDAVPTGAVPPPARDALAALARTCVAINLRLRHDLARVLGAFARAGIPVMPLKGPVLADEIYPAPLLRQTRDLDILVRVDDRARAARVLEDLGYARRPDDQQGADYHTIFTNDATDVELHHDVGERHVSRMNIDGIWTSAHPTCWQGNPVWSMSAPDLLVYLAFHAAKDGLASLRALVDIALLVDRDRDVLPWTSLAGRVRDAHLAPVVYLALSQARELLGARVPDEFLEGIRPRQAGWWLAERLFHWRGGVLHVADELLVGPVMAALMLLWEPTARARLRHLRRNMLPSPGLRGRWTSAPARTSWVLWYPAWIAQAARQLLRQLAAPAPNGLYARELGDAEEPRPVLGPDELGASLRHEMEEQQLRERSARRLRDRIAVVPLAAAREDDRLPGIERPLREAQRR